LPESERERRSASRSAKFARVLRGRARAVGL
jgi:hypothetical protein